MIRKGIPPPLRCAVWLSNIIQASHPHQDLKYAHEYRTLAKVRVLDHAYNCLWHGENASLSRSSITNRISDYEAIVPNAWVTFGHTSLLDQINELPQSGRLALKRVLYSLEFVLGIEYAPMIPTLAMLFLGSMSQSYAFTAIREMAHHSTWYWPCSESEYFAHKRAFLDILSKLHPGTASAIQRCGIGERFTNAIFQDFFLPLLPESYVLRIVDIYTLEGSKVLFRLGVAIAVLFHKESKSDLTQSVMEETAETSKASTMRSGEGWLEGLVEWTNSDKFDFELMLRKAYGVHGKGVRKRYRFPRRPILSRILRLEEERYSQQQKEVKDRGIFQQPLIRPLGLILNKSNNKASLDSEVREPRLAEPYWVRLKLADWLPLSLRLTKLELIFSTDYDGRTLESFYSHVRKAKHTILLIEPLRDSHFVHSVGMYASQTWIPSKQVYGDGSCFLFRLSEEDNTEGSICWKWKPKVQNNEQILVEEENDNETALLEQFQVGTKSYISMGGNLGGSSGLRLNEDLTKAESSSAFGFDNDPLLPGHNIFEVGLVEVYRLVRSIDGIPIS